MNSEKMAIMSFNSETSTKEYIATDTNINKKFSENNLEFHEKIINTIEIFIACSVAKVQQIIENHPVLSKKPVQATIAVTSALPGSIPVMIAVGGTAILVKKILEEK